MCKPVHSFLIWSRPHILCKHFAYLELHFQKPFWNKLHPFFCCIVIPGALKLGRRYLHGACAQCFKLVVQRHMHILHSRLFWYQKSLPFQHKIVPGSMGLFYSALPTGPNGLSSSFITEVLSLLSFILSRPQMTS